ncbi:hypothetical protein IEQ34_020758 [Dendrobium chrysotoxum]|uniref:DNA polymerase alpha subunit B n=1 Tax=Dendrobium chrysotoxum TaxID=161865 RepID=A0AAV7G1U4_DENCH|nr:hypothetical protein IEQ34_020758 [Dendrobium chrysotoxum]
MIFAARTDLEGRCRDCTHRFFGYFVAVRLRFFGYFVAVRLRFFDDFPFPSDRKLRHFDRKQQRELAGCEGFGFPRGHFFVAASDSHASPPNSAMDTEIKAEFEKGGFSMVEEDEILQKCLTYCINYNLSPADLVANWEIYYLNRQLNGLRIETSYMDGFLTHLQHDQKERIIKEEPNLHIYSSNDIDMLHGEEQDSIKEGLLNTPNHFYERPDLESNAASTPATSEKSSSTMKLNLNSRITPFGQRMNKFVSQFTLNDQLTGQSLNSKEPQNMDDDVIRRIQPGERCSLHIHCSLPEPGCRFMYDKIEDRFNSLDYRIKRHSSAFLTSGLYGEPNDATLASQKNIFAVGMICCDGEGRLNEKSIMLQGSVEHSGGQSVRVDLQKLHQFSLFPGQVIGIEGHNPSGHCLLASKVIEKLPVAPDVGLPPAKKQAMDHEQQGFPSITSRVLSVVLATGPFTTTDNMLFEPFKELLAYATRKQPQLLILMGPFIDSEHPEIKKGTVDRTFDEIFHVEILRRLQDYTQYMGSAVRVILVPSIRDANHDFVFPQSAFDIEISDDTKHQISGLANPCLFSTNEVITDNASVCRAAGLLVEQTYPHIFWTPCVVHTLNLALKNICATKNIEANEIIYAKCHWITTVADDAVLIINFIMNYSMRLSMFNDFSHLRMLAVTETRFASVIIMLKRFKQIKSALQSMVISEKWSCYREDDIGKAMYVKEKVLDDLWWDNVDYILAFTDPIYDMLREADTDKSCLHLIYEMYSSKEWLQQDPQRVSPQKDLEVSNMRKICLKRYFPNEEERRKINIELAKFFGYLEDFGDQESLVDRWRMDPKMWWLIHGASAPLLQTITIKLLGQVSSSSCCERNWSTYSFIQSMKRNKITPQRAEDLVYTNLRLLSRKTPLYMTGDNKMWDVAGDGFECLDDMRLLEVANLSLDEPELEAMIFNDDDIDG